LDEISNTISLFTAADGTNINPNQDYGQIMWSGTAKANFMSAMMVPSYDYLSGKDKSIVKNL
jgi:hypothetical protein